MKKEWETIYKVLAIIEAVLLLVLSFAYGSRIDKQKEIIENKNNKIKECSYEIKRLKLIEQNYEEEKEYLYQCYKDIELKAERSGK